MKTEITDKTYIILTNYGNKIYITEEQYNNIYSNFDNIESVKIKNQAIINKKYIVMIARADEIEINEKEHKGMWQCDYGEWHKRGEKCGHAEGAKYI